MLKRLANPVGIEPTLGGLESPVLPLYEGNVGARQVQPYLSDDGCIYSITLAQYSMGVSISRYQLEKLAFYH